MRLLSIASALSLIGYTSAQCAKSYTVSPGDYCWAIANNNGLTLDALLTSNPGLNCNNLQIGVTVCLSGTGGSSGPTPQPNPTPAPTTGCGKTYTVAPGDFCWAIATNNGQGLDQLLANNPGLNCNSLQVGQSVCLSAPGTGPSPQPNPLPNPNPVPTPSGGKLVSYDEFANALTACGYGKPSQDKYNALISSHAPAGGITTKRELAMFLSEILHESGGLQFKSELACGGNNCAGSYRVAGDHPAKFYYGRGYIQLSWSYNYRAASKALYNDERLINDPDLVARDEKVAWETTLWFWKANVRTDPGVQRGQLGSATNRINGALECNPCKLSCPTRFKYYSTILRTWNVNETPSNAGC